MVTWWCGDMIMWWYDDILIYGAWCVMHWILWQRNHSKTIQNHIKINDSGSGVSNGLNSWFWHPARNPSKTFQNHIKINDSEPAASNAGILICWYMELYGYGDIMVQWYCDMMVWSYDDLVQVFHLIRVLKVLGLI